MNKKVKSVLIFFAIALICLMPFYKPEADSGFDGSYSGGSSGGFLLSCEVGAACGGACECDWA